MDHVSLCSWSWNTVVPSDDTRHHVTRLGLRVAADRQTILPMLAFNLWSQNGCCKVDIALASLLFFSQKRSQKSQQTFVWA